MDSGVFRDIHGLVNEGIQEVIDRMPPGPKSEVFDDIKRSVNDVFEDPHFYKLDMVPTEFKVPESFTSKGVVGLHELVGKLYWDIEFFSRPPLWPIVKQYTEGMRDRAIHDLQKLTGIASSIEVSDLNLKLTFCEVLAMHDQQRLFYARPVESHLVEHFWDHQKTSILEGMMLSTITKLITTS